MRYFLVVLLIGLIFFSGCVSQDEKKTIETNDQNLQADLINNLTFSVEVPENTPDGDIINLVYNFPTYGEKYPFKTLEIPMEKIEPYKYKLSLLRETFGLEDEWNQIEYIYNRNGWGDITTEYLPLKPEDKEPGNPFEYRNAKREVIFEKGKIVEDTVQRWRWFPEGKVEKTSNIDPKGDFVSRIDGIEFRSSVGIQDLYIEGFDKFFNSTARHIVNMNYNWVAVYPPWQWYQDNPPKVGNIVELGLGEEPNYPDDGKLKEQIRAFRDLGLEISMEHQICCTFINTEGRSAEWWNLYADEVERFLIHHAKLAEEAGAKQLIFDTFGIDREEIPDYNERVSQMLQNVSAIYSGEIIIPISPFLYQIEAAENTIPTVNEVPWAKDANLFLYFAEGELSAKENPTNEELKEGAGRSLDLMKPFYDKYNKPVIIRVSPSSIKQAWRGPTFYGKGKVPGESGAEDVWESHSHSNEDQARVINAYWQAIGERPWIIGMSSFGYWHWDMPNLPDWSIRGKPAEDVWKKWNEFIFNSASKN